MLSDSIELIDPKTLVIEVLEDVEVDTRILFRIKELKDKGYKIALDDFAESIQTFPIVPMADIIKYDIIVYQRIIAELYKKEPSFEELANIVRTDVNMAYRVMKVLGNVQDKDLNKTIKGALLKMGFRELERWVNVLMLQELSGNKTQELIKISLIRSKFGELIAINCNFINRRYEISLMCLFSVLDTMLDQTMEEVLVGIAVSEDVKEVLIHHQGELKPIYDIIICYEQGNCGLLDQITTQIGIDKTKLFDWYLKAIAWTEEIMTSVL